MDRRVVAFVDLEALRPALEAAGADAVRLAQKLAAYARGQGRLLSARMYGDLSTDEVRELRKAGCDGVVTTEDGDGSAPESVALALDAAEMLGNSPPPEIVLLATDDAQLAELVRRWRRKGAYVVCIVPLSLSAQEPAKGADRTISAEQLLADQPIAEAPEMKANRPLRAASPTMDVSAIDWSKLVVLLRDLEAKMPFVGMKWLKNKVLGPHNVGVSTIADKQVLLNRAVDEGLLETYRVGNREGQGEPVTACRLIRNHPKVQAILAANPGSSPDAAAPSESSETR